MEREVGIDKAWIMLRLRDLSETAQEANQYGPSVRAVELMGKEKGMFVDKHEVRGGPLEDFKLAMSGTNALGTVKAGHPDRTKNLPALRVNR